MGNKHLFSRLKKKGIVLDETVVLIVGLILMLVIIFGILYYTGLLSNFTSSMQALICMMSAYFRGFAIMILWVLVSMLLAMITIATVATFAKSTPSWASSATGTDAFIIKTGFGAPRLLFYGALLGVISTLFSSIPLMCSATAFHQGSLRSPIEDNTKIAYVLQDKITDCWQMYGSGALNPLWGVDPPNPNICFVSNIFVKNSISMKDLYYKMVERDTNWKLSYENNADPKIMLFCPNNLGTDPDNWGDCIINNKTVYVSYKDEHPFAYMTGLKTSFGTGICGGQITGKRIHGGGDFIVLCVESLVFPRESLSDRPAVCGDGIIHPDETCSSCPEDVHCDYGQQCIDDVCLFCSLEGEYCNDPTIDAVFCCDGQELACDYTSLTCVYEIGGT